MRQPAFGLDFYTTEHCTANYLQRGKHTYVSFLFEFCQRKPENRLGYKGEAGMYKWCELWMLQKQMMLMLQRQLISLSSDDACLKRWWSRNFPFVCFQGKTKSISALLWGDTGGTRDIQTPPSDIQAPPLPFQPHTLSTSWAFRWKRAVRILPVFSLLLPWSQSFPQRSKPSTNESHLQLVGFNFGQFFWWVKLLKAQRVGVSKL